jgi:hypothetical protein
MAFDLLAAAKWLGPKAIALAHKLLSDHNAAALQSSRDEHAGAAATEIARMILSGLTTANVTLANLIREYDALLTRGARVPRDVRTMVDTLIQKAREAEFREFRPDHRPGGWGHARPAAKKSAAKRAVAKKSAAKQPAAKKSSARRPAAKKSAAKSPPAKKTGARRAAAKKFGVRKP